MHIDGHNNRVAGRDYYEQATLKLTPEQLAQLSIKPCVKCETRVVALGVTTCNHCRRKAQAEENYNKWVRYGFVVFLIWGTLLTREQKSGTHVTPFHLLELGVTAVGIVVVAVASWFMIRIFWLEHGDDISKSLTDAVSRLFK
ncbi:hypothetical protein [Pseudomonas sp. BGI-2]|uniref:hypothetical protein n=1 Tax=Pseudomonas sp. BGI-2 TaxID=2528211 RepID=UPI001034ADA9|nr:hypothetical protein [Pseudomonas sp. BGI-2]TBN39173.1 hypothetical protein EYC95_21335 [Pseudomonas sp. BGI-2]